jgi:hypothetical protein
MTTKLLTIPGLHKDPEPATDYLVFDIHGKIEKVVHEYPYSNASVPSNPFLRITDLNNCVVLSENGFSKFKLQPGEAGSQKLIMNLDAVALNLKKGTYIVEVLFKQGLSPSVHKKYFITFNGVTLNP